MLYFLLILFILLAVYFLCRLFLLRRSISRASEELKAISQNLEENRILKLSCPDKELEKLLEAINENLLAIRSQRREYIRREQNLREQIENISHDLRTPLTAILGYMKMMDQEELSQQDKEFLDVAIRKSHTLQELTAQFYELSRITDKNFQMELQPVDAGRILRETCLDHYGLIEKAGIELEITGCDGGEWGSQAVIQGNAQALERIFSNLLQNSVRYARSRLKISLGEESGTEKLKIVFENDIVPGTQVPDPSRLFDRFYMQEQSRSHGGTGLGLTISKSLAEHMNGTIKAEYANKEEKKPEEKSGGNSKENTKEAGENTESGQQWLTFTITFPLQDKSF